MPSKKYNPDKHGRRCGYCGEVLDYFLNNYSLDHIVPRSMGGSDKESNLRACCRQCNRDKASLSLKAFRKKFFKGKALKKFYFEDNLPKIRMYGIEIHVKPRPDWVY